MRAISMATGGDPGAALQDETTCSICLDYFQDPLMIIDCGHNFCRAWITRDSGGGGSDLSVSCCPVCRKPFSWDNLRANRHLGNVAEVIQQFRLQRLSEAEGVQKVCWEHKEVFELFCREDRAFICLTCKESQAHKPHMALPLDQAVQEYQDQIQNHMTFLKKERDEILKMKISNEKVIKETMRSVIYIREQKERAFTKEEVHTVSALLRDIEEKTVQMADENASDALEHSAHLTQLIREMEAKCLQQPAFEFLQDIGAFLSKCEREMARKPKAELRMTADSILQKLQLVQHKVVVFQRRKSSRLVRSRLLSLQAGLCNFLYDSPGVERGCPSGFNSPSAPAGHSSLALFPWPSRNKEDKEKRLTEFSILVGSNRTTDEDKSKRVQGFGSTKEMDQSQVKPSSSEVSDAGERKAQAVTATTAALNKAGRSKTPELFPVLLLPVMQASLRLNQMPPGHVQLSTADLHRSDLEAAGSSGSHSPALRGELNPSQGHNVAGMDSGLGDPFAGTFPFVQAPSSIPSYSAGVGSPSIAGAPFLPALFSQTVADWILQAWRSSWMGPPQKVFPSAGMQEPELLGVEDSPGGGSRNTQREPDCQGCKRQWYRRGNSPSSSPRSSSLEENLHASQKCPQKLLSKRYSQHRHYRQVEDEEDRSSSFSRDSLRWTVTSVSKKRLHAAESKLVSEVEEMHSIGTSLGANSDKEEGEWSGENSDSKDSSRFFQSEHYQRLLKKVMTTLNYQVEASEKHSYSACFNLDGRGFKKLYKNLSVCPFPEFFDEVLRAGWAVPGNGNSLNTIVKKFCALPEGTMEALEVPLVQGCQTHLLQGPNLI